LIVVFGAAVRLTKRLTNSCKYLSFLYVAMQLTDGLTDSREILIFHYFKAITNGV
jgi:hypothetical protein